MVYVKNSTSATVNNRRAVVSTKQHFGDGSSYTGDAVADSTNFIQGMISDGFQVGSGVNVNETSTTNYWFAFGGSVAMPAASGTFSMDQGSYTGTGTGFAISSLAFAPDLIMIKDNSTNYAVFRTRDMAGDTTAYLANAVADFAGGVTSMNSNGFNIGTSTIVNTSGTVYHWQAFGNAYRADKYGGAADFAIGTFYGNGIDDRNIIGMPFQPDLVTIKRNSTTAGTFRTTSMTGDLSSFFGATAEASNVIQSFSTTGFQVGTNAASNTAASLHRWFAFKVGTNFAIGTYTGDGVDNKAITSAGLKPDLAWIKRTTAVAGVLKPTTLAGDNTQYFANTANAAGRIKSFINTGFTLGTQTETNASAGSYRYAAWRVPIVGVLSNDIVDGSGASIATPSLSLNSLGYPFDCNQSTGTLGTASQKLRVSNMTSNPTWTTSITATSGSTALWANGGNTQQFDYNDVSGSPAGCSDGGDADTKAGKLRVEPSSATITPLSGCSASNISLGSNQDFTEGSINTITLATGTSSADVECYWDLTNIILKQYVPIGQSPDNYLLNLTITTVAS